MDVRGRLLGKVIGETSHAKVVFLSKTPPRVGQYVLVEYPEGEFVLGMVEQSLSGNPMAPPDAVSMASLERVERFEPQRYLYYKGVARLLAWVDENSLAKGRIEAPKHPPPPLANVYEAGAGVLRLIFAPQAVNEGDDRWVRIGVLANHPDVPVHLDVDMLVSRHLAILAVTGAGKSNTVAILATRIVEKLKGTVLLLDMHSEYGGLSEALSNVNIITPRLNPMALSSHELLQLMNIEPGRAHIQERFARIAWREARKEGLRRPEEFFETMRSRLEALGMQRKLTNTERNSLQAVINKLDDLEERYRGLLFDPTAPIDLEATVKPGYINILSLGGLDEQASDAVVSHYLRRILDERKRWKRSRGEEGYPVPIMIVVEEAHILIPRSRSTLTKYQAARIAREGRKFGVGLCLVSQRPKNIDEDALSQTNNKIILRLVEPNDQKYVQAASETLSDELLELLPSLNVGEAIILGLMLPLPALVKIDKFTYRLQSSDVQASREWEDYAKRRVDEDRLLSDIMMEF